jgi:hypothetical protein
MVTHDTIISGERLQMLCDVYCGSIEDLNRNPLIARDYNKHMVIDYITTEWDNPSVIFCYSCALQKFMDKLVFLKNPCVLVSHNEDNNITDTYMDILNCPKINKWFAQNIMIRHPKLHMLPIGIANAMWVHGNIDNFISVQRMNLPKLNDIYFYFTVETNQKEREMCKNILVHKGLTFGDHRGHLNYLVDLSTHKFAISPPGNGIDCHRIWECYYLKVIPVLLRSTFTEIVSEVLPCILLDTWEDFDYNSIIPKYDELVKRLDDKLLDINYYKHLIYHNY